MNRTLDVATSSLVGVARLGHGWSVAHTGVRPEKLLELYEFEACPFCRKVREMLSVLDLDAMVYPCPRDGTRFRPKAKELGGRAMFPYLVDPNTGTALYESDDINRYLAKTYGDGTVPLALSLGPLTILSSALGSAFRAGHGRAASPSKAPALPLELYSFEVSPYCRIAREALCELEIPYVLHNVAKGSPKRAAFEALSGKMMVPYLVDPNTGAAMFESAEIVSYLRRSYGA
nr:glutathione S-transferase N-terminal domain-containing protein [Deltaproteobacteria bacterium]